MANPKLTWWRIPNQSLSVAIRNAGFDLAVYDTYSAETQREVKKRGTRQVLELLRDEFYGVSGRKIRSIRRGVYVICTSSPFTVSYGEQTSRVLYIGMGNVYNRIRSHYKRSLFNFMLSLSGINFDFYFCEPKRQKYPQFHSFIEYKLLETFQEKFGCLPLLNRSGRRPMDGTMPRTGWNRPLKGGGPKLLWSIAFQQSDIGEYLLD